MMEMEQDMGKQVVQSIHFHLMEMETETEMEMEMDLETLEMYEAYGLEKMIT